MDLAIAHFDLPSDPPNVSAPQPLHLFPDPAPPVATRRRGRRPTEREGESTSQRAARERRNERARARYASNSVARRERQRQRYAANREQAIAMHEPSPENTSPHRVPAHIRASQRAIMQGVRASASQEDRDLLSQRRRESRAQDQILRNLEQEYIDAERAYDNQLRPFHPRTLENLAFHYDADYDYHSLSQLSIDLMTKTCQRCNARLFRKEAPGICCSNGKCCMLRQYTLPPAPESELYDVRNPDGKHMLEYIMRYNSCFAMTSLGINGQRLGAGDWPSTFRIQGQIYHQIGSLLPQPESDAQYVQIYFMGDSDCQIDRRTGMFQGVRRNLVALFQHLLERENDLIRNFKTALERMPADTCSLAIRADRLPEGVHPGQFNAPVVEDVALHFIAPEDAQNRDIILTRRNDRLSYINETHQFYDALQYPLMFWSGQPSYSISMRDPATNKKITAKQFYSYQFMVRDNVQNIFHYCGKLTNQYFVDMYTKIELGRLKYLRSNQKKLRADEYIHLRDALRNDGDPNEVGKRIILPSSFIGSPRHLREYTQDAMAYVLRFGRPDLFLTYTCNPTMPEFRELLFNGQTVNDRHDIVARLFHQKVGCLVDVLRKDKIFGPVRAYLFSIEWQKRGLPHVHMLIWLSNPIRADEIDKVLSAEIPDPQVDPALYATVTNFMIHGPCGALNGNSPCMSEGRCTKKYPRGFMEETLTGEDGYPLYRRRSPEDGGRIFNKRVRGQMTQIDNRWVVPYNPTLLRLFPGHMNIEICHSVRSIKYLFKYVYKGSDIMGMVVENQQDRDEISEFQIGRFLSCNEACWRIFGFPVHERSIAVHHLQVHLENGQRIVWDENRPPGQVPRPPSTTLTAFFALCSRDEFAQTLIYQDVPSYFTYDGGIFSRRIKGQPVVGWPGVKEVDDIGRLYTVSPRQLECFHLRILLTHVRGPKSFQDIKTFEGHICSTYQEACRMRGLIADDEQWMKTLEESAALHLPNQMRELFAVILCQCYPSNPTELWDKFKDDLSQDILNRMRRQNPDLELQFNDLIWNEALILLEDLSLSISGKELAFYSMPSPTRDPIDVSNAEILRERTYPRAELIDFVEQNTPLLNEQQKRVQSLLLDAIERELGGIYLIDAPGGTGKTFLLNLLLAEVRSQGNIMLATASSGIAATNYDGGRTAHSAFGIPLKTPSMPNPTSSITRGSAKGIMLKACKAIIWDECTMMHKKCFELVDRLLQDIRDNTLPFGGMVVILAGDFRQTLPVTMSCTPADSLHACLKTSYLWSKIAKFNLHTNMRVQMLGDPNAEQFASDLLSIGEGRFWTDPRNGMIPLTRNICTHVSLGDDLIAKVYPDLLSNMLDPDWLRDRSILAPHNVTVNEINAKILDKLVQTPARVFKSVDTCRNPEDATSFPTEVLNSLHDSDMPPHELTLKVGAPIMILRNIRPPKLCNGTRLVITSLQGYVIHAKIIAGKHRGEHVLIPRIPFHPENLIVQMQRLQFPVRLAYALTINKSQGQTLKVAGIELAKQCFSHGQLYVALSRVGSPSSLFIHTFTGHARNVVYRRALTYIDGRNIN